jgi:BlaI family transcriptional regulator, penicillinase repressor
MAKTPITKDVPPPDISPAEHNILRGLWDTGQASIREVHDHIHSQTSWAYTTTKTVMDRMVAKGLLERSNIHGVFVYKTNISRAAGLARFVRFFADRVVERDMSVVLGLFNEAEVLNDADIAELKVLIESLPDQLKRARLAG